MRITFNAVRRGAVDRQGFTASNGTQLKSSAVCDAAAGGVDCAVFFDEEFFDFVSRIPLAPDSDQLIFRYRVACLINIAGAIAAAVDVLILTAAVFYMIEGTAFGVASG